ncbi:MAG: TIGR00730 family Rossman fold protein [Phycisphaerales bacterium JB043]
MSERLVDPERQSPEYQHDVLAGDGMEHDDAGARANDVRDLLAGPESRLKEALRVVRICLEFIRGFRKLHFTGPCVTVFGSARFEPGHEYYEMARAVGGALVRQGFTVMTGGGPGVMEGANRGAREAEGRSLGINIVLPHEQDANPYVDKVVTFKYFFVRKVMLVKYSYAFIALPGGFGTMDEIFETATLIQTGKIERFPLVLMGTKYWGPLIDFVRETMLEEGTIGAEDIQNVLITDDPEEAALKVREYGMKHLGLKEKGPRRPLGWLFEKR